MDFVLPIKACSESLDVGSDSSGVFPVLYIVGNFGSEAVTVIQFVLCTRVHLQYQELAVLLNKYK